MQINVHFLLVILALLLTPRSSMAQEAATLPQLDGRNGRPLALDRFRPKSMLKVKRTKITAAKFPVVDVHTHFGFRLKNSAEQLDNYVQVMDRHNIAVCVSLDAKLGLDLNEHQRFLWQKYQNRFAIFVHLDWQGSGDTNRPETWDCQRPDFARRIARQLATAKQQGACGLKLFKRFGLTYRNPDGSFVRIDEPRWDPIWSACGDLKLPVIIHSADPAAFFLAIDETNERWEELHRHPNWSFPAATHPSREDLLAARNRVIAKHSKTVFIGAHVANNPEDLATVAEWLDRYPNLYVEIASRIGELGRQPYTARQFLVKYADRVLFGTDGPFPAARLIQYWRFLETFDEYFPYSETEFPPQGFWNIYGVGLPDDVLRKVYHENAIRIIPGVKERMEQYERNQQRAPRSATPSTRRSVPVQ